MAKDKLEDWDEVAANNLDMGGISLAENVMRPPAVNNEMREHMAQVSKWLGDDTLAAAATTDLGAVPGRYISITGNTTITAFGTIKSGTIKYLKFTGTPTITYNATSMILPGAVSIVAAAGDTAIFASEGSGNWRLVSYLRAVSTTPVAPLGQCYLDRSGSNLVLSPLNGNLISINGVNYTVPSAGVSLAPTSLTPATAYYIYAFMSSGTMTLEAVVTAPAVNTTTGVMQKTGDATRTLVGLWLVTTGPAWSTVACQGASWFNPQPKMSSGGIGGTTSTATSLAELATGCRLSFVSFSGRQVRYEVSGSFASSLAAQNGALDIGLDGTTNQLAASSVVRNSAALSGQNSYLSGAVGASPSAGTHYITPLVLTSSGTATWSATYVSATIMG